MKKVLILGIIALLTAVFAYRWLLVPDDTERSRGADDVVSVEPGVENESEAEENTIPESGFGTLEELRALGESIECSITYQTEEYDQPIEGTYFVSDGDIRGDFLTPAPDLSGQMLSSMIIVDSVMHVWSEIDGESYGVQMDLSLVDEADADRSEPVALDANVSYECKEWENVDRTVFTPPGDVRFQDFNDLMQSGMEYGTVYEEGEMIAPEF